MIKRTGTRFTIGMHAATNDEAYGAAHLLREFGAPAYPLKWSDHANVDFSHYDDGDHLVELTKSGRQHKMSQAELIQYTRSIHTYR